MSEHDAWGKLPGLAVVIGIAGLIPFIVLGLASVTLDDAKVATMLAGLIAYGAVILSFVGAVHWGFALAGIPRNIPLKLTRLRLVLSVVPSLVGWAAVLLSIVFGAEAALGLLVAGFVAAPVLEQQGYNRGLTPPRYMWLRWGLTIVVLAVLVTVLTVRLIGAKLR